MNARQALINYARQMVKIYGANYVEHWTTDDAETFEILARRARKVFDNRQIATRDNTPYLLRMRGHRIKGITASDERKAAWQAHADKYGNGHQGRLSPARPSLYGFSYIPPEYTDRTGKPLPLPPKHSDDVDSSSVFASLMAQFSG